MSDDNDSEPTESLQYRAIEWQSTIGTGCILLVATLIPSWSLHLRWQGFFNKETSFDIILILLFLCSGIFCILLGVHRKIIWDDFSRSQQEQIKEMQKKYAQKYYLKTKQIIMITLLGVLLFWGLLRINMNSRDNSKRHITNMPSVESIFKRNQQQTKDKSKTELRTSP